MLVVLDEVPDYCWKEIEQSYIRVFRALGMRLTNLLDGGEGFSSGDKHPRPHLGKKWPAEIIRRQAEARRGLKRTPETRAKIAAKLMGNKNGRFRRRNSGGGGSLLLPFDP